MNNLNLKEFRKWKQGEGTQEKLVMDLRGNYISTACSATAAKLFVKAHNASPVAKKRKK